MGEHRNSQDFFSEALSVIKENLSDEKFGVSDLASKMKMSRSGLLRKIRKHSDLSVNQLIRNTRLEKGKELLKNSTLTVSEVAFAVGFGSSSYFIKCYHDHYGYSPGQIELVENNNKLEKEDLKSKRSFFLPFLYPSITLILIILILILYFRPFTKKIGHFEKSIAVLPFINDSSDSSNLYLVNGMMEAILNNLQKVEDLHVISRTSVEKFRKSSKSIPELSKELKANYFVEGSGQKKGDEILLYIQLIEAPTDRHLWSGKFRRKSSDIFDLQSEVSQTIAKKIEAIITPEEAERINKVPTKNLVAYDHFLKGLDLLNGGNMQSVLASLPYFDQAILEDNNFARAYAAKAIAFYFLDASKAEKKYSKELNELADKSLFLDPQLPQGHVAKALYYINIGDYAKAIPYFEKALDFNPNSKLALGFLTDFYTNFSPNTEKYLEYALRGTRLDIASKDSISASYIYLHLANAFIQSGFVKEAREYIEQSLQYDPTNLFSEYVKAYIIYAENLDFRELNSLLLNCLEKDSSRYDILQEVAKSFFYLREYKNASIYYDQFLQITKEQNLNVYNSENAKIGLVFREIGENIKSQTLFDQFREYAVEDNSLYKELSLAVWFANQGKKELSFQHFENFTKEENFHYWTLLFLPQDPLVDPIKNDPRFEQLMKKITQKFWAKHDSIRIKLKDKELIK